MILGRGYDIPDSSVSKTDSLSYAARFSRLPIERKSEFRKDLRASLGKTFGILEGVLPEWL